MSTEIQASGAEKVSTKVCPCGSTNLIKLESISRKLCNNCKNSIIWPLDKGQERLNGSHRAGRKIKEHGQ